MQASTFSLSVLAFRDHLQQADGGRLREVNICIGHPAQLAKSLGPEDQLVNIFAFEIENSGYPTNAGNKEAYFVSLHCLLTPMNGSNDTGSGEIELQLLGHIMEILHRYPQVNVEGTDGSVIAQLQVVPSKLDSESLNRVFSTQFETSYRTSVAYELAMVPVFVEPPQDTSRVAAISLSVSPEISDLKHLPGETGSHFETQYYSKAIVDVDEPDWQPHVVFVDQTGNLTYRLQYELAENIPPARVLALGYGEASLRTQKRAGAGDWTQLEDRRISLEQQAIDVTTNNVWSDLINLPLSGVEAILDEPGQVWVWVERLWQPDGKPPVNIRSNALEIYIREARS